MVMINVVMNIYNIVVTLVLMLYFLTGKRLHIRLNRYFVYMCICNIMMTLGDTITWLCEGYAKPWYPSVLWWGMLIFYIFSAPLLLAFVCYIVEYLSERVNVSKAFSFISLVLAVIHVVWILLAQTNGMFYYFNEQNQYVRGDWFLFSQLIPFVIYFIGCGLIIFFRKHIRRKDFLALSAYVALPAVAEAVQIMNYGISLLNVGITINLLLIFINIQSERELLMEERERELAESRIDIMLSQINPHFLYNALTSIRQLCELDPAAAKDSIRDFAFFLRANMDSLTNKSPIPFTQELEHIKHYLRLEQQRFRERLEVVYDIKSEDFSVPPLSVQPITENAVRHGIFKKTEGGIVTIRSEETNDAYVITITDNGIGFDEKALLDEGKSHVGIANVRSRLHLMSNGALSVESMIDKGTTATITIPKESEGQHEIFTGR